MNNLFSITFLNSCSGFEVCGMNGISSECFINLLFHSKLMKASLLRWGWHAVLAFQLPCGYHQNTIPSKFQKACSTLFFICISKVNMWKIKMQNSIQLQANDSYKSYMECILKTYSENGIRSFYVGLNSTLIRWVIGKSTVCSEFLY